MLISLAYNFLPMNALLNIVFEGTLIMTAFFYFKVKSVDDSEALTLFLTAMLLPNI